MVGTIADAILSHLKLDVRWALARNLTTRIAYSQFLLYLLFGDELTFLYQDEAHLARNHTDEIKI